MIKKPQGLFLAANIGALIFSNVLVTPAVAEEPFDLQHMSIEELAQVEVTSVSKFAQPLSDAPAAVYVISDEDIRRSAATSLPEVLRLAPNLLVQRIDARQYSISARGFSGFETSNKLLGLIDGRTIYSPLHAGIFWDLREPLLEDIERVEVISGPGGTLWGPNAVNGVINITSKSAMDTHGGLIRGTAGARERTVGVRYGAALGGSGAFRVYANGFERDGLPGGSAPDVPDGGKGIRVGFRADWSGEASDFTLQGDYFYNDLDNDLIGKGRDTGHNILARWTRRTGENSTFQVQAYYDKTDRRAFGVEDHLDTIDLSAQHNIALGSHQIVWGAGLRTTHDLFINRLNAFVLDPSSKRLWVGNLFAQDSWALGQGLTLIAGIKLERTSFTGFEVLPNVRIAWKPAEKALFWAAVSRGLRTPSRIDRDLIHPIFLENGSFESEGLTTFEMGYRGQPWPGGSLSISLFYNLYDRLRTTELHPVTLLPLRLDNGLKGQTYGIEAWGGQQILPWWRVSVGIATLHKDFHLKPGHADLENGISLGNDPDFHASFRSQMNLGERMEFDFLLRGVDSLPEPQLAGYVDADARIALNLDDGLELFVVGSNLFHKLRDQSGDTDRGQMVARTVSAGARFSF